MSEQEFEQETVEVEQWETAEVVLRPRWPKVIGIISIVWASIGLACGGIGLLFLPFASSLMSMGLQEGEPVPYGLVSKPADYAIAGLGFLFALLLLFAGIACVSHRPVTRVMHLVYGLAAIPMSLWSYMNQMHKNELNAQWAKEFPNSEMAQGFDPAQNPAAAAGELIGLVILIVFGFGIPLFYLIWFGLVKTKPEQITGGDEGVY
ncbi:MAG: hypothetical protein CMJ35_14300 [Phycisphaerae bacterium]|nr:hypothetical protein [Phycisphaerae bacterium]MBM92759.1 hypothetical protein [Phycisphaerae bacterium]HCT43731.1 hypothetical protein [Phycisphaerales bacterium]|tara:strand:- start:622 stop:1239 length:618 start_codon:yes stop_codon:yes gene_type:complete